MKVSTPPPHTAPSVSPHAGRLSCLTSLTAMNAAQRSSTPLLLSKHARQRELDFLGRGTSRYRGCLTPLLSQCLLGCISLGDMRFNSIQSSQRRSGSADIHRRCNLENVCLFLPRPSGNQCRRNPTTRVWKENMDTCLVPGFPTRRVPTPTCKPPAAAKALVMNSGHPPQAS
jgi:hypothetical protein